MKYITVFCKDENEYNILKEVVYEYGTSQGWFTTALTRFPDCDTHIVSVGVLDEQSAFNFGFIYSKKLRLLLP